MWYYSHDPYEIIIFGQLWTRITLKKLKPNKYQIYQALLNCLKPKLLPTPRYCCKESQREPCCFPHVWAVILCDELWPGSLGGGTCESYTTMPGYLQYLHYPGHWSFRDTSNTSHCNIEGGGGGLTRQVPSGMFYPTIYHWKRLALIVCILWALGNNYSNYWRPRRL